MELGYLAALVATMPGGWALMLDRDELNLADQANEIMRTKAVETRAEFFAVGEISLSADHRFGRL
jgi:hypothetical protein